MPLQNKNSFNRVWWLAIFAFISSIALAQTTPDPSLHHRGDPDPSNHPVVVKPGKRISAIPEEASGEYLINTSGDLIEITLQFGELSGYITKRGEGDSDSGAQLTYFFDKTALHGTTLEFTTEQVHGLWYQFKGTITRGPGRTKAEDGYYLLVGDLVEHDTARQAVSRHAISLKLAKQLD